MSLRGVDWPVLAGASALGAAGLAVCVLAAGDEPPLAYARLALVPLASAAAFVLDEPAAAAVDALPRSRRRRTASRVSALTLPLGVWAAAVIALDVRSPRTPAAVLLAEGAGLLAVAVAVAAVLRLRGRAEPGEAVAVLLGAGVLGLLVLPLPQSTVPLFPTDGHWAASGAVWTLLTVAATVTATLASRDAFLPPGHGRHDGLRPRRSPP